MLDLPVPGEDIDYEADLSALIADWTRFYAATEDVHDGARFEREVAADDRVHTRGIEVGQVFYFGTKYSEPMKALVTGPDGVERPIHGGSYGIGVSASGRRDHRGEPRRQRHRLARRRSRRSRSGLVNLKVGDAATDAACEDIYAALVAAGVDVLYDDTAERAGVKFSTMDLIGLAVAGRGRAARPRERHVELKCRATGETHRVRAGRSAGTDRSRTPMSDLLWQKDGVAVDARIMRFLAGDDVVLDREFFLHDIAASKVHVDGLARIGVIEVGEAVGADRASSIRSRTISRMAGFVLDDRYEDGHSAIEARLIERLGDAGRKVHTGRSRNDQILVATRLWLKARLVELVGCVPRDRGVCLDRAAREALPLPGYTHLQRAVVSSTALWFAGFAEAFIDDAMRARDTLAWIDANPLGTAAGYGVNLPLDREHATAALGFARLQINPVYAQLSRGKFEIGALDALGAALLDLRRLAWDLSLFTTAEFGFVQLPAEYTTGSSIMPNKRNPDVVELMRASYASVCRGAHRDRAAACRCRRVISAIFSSARARSCTASRADSRRSRCCPISWRVSTGTKRGCAPRSSRRCMRPTSAIERPRVVCRFVRRIEVRRPRRSGGRGQDTARQPRGARVAGCRG